MTNSNNDHYLNDGYVRMYDSDLKDWRLVKIEDSGIDFDSVESVELQFKSMWVDRPPEQNVVTLEPGVYKVVADTFKRISDNEAAL